MVSALPRSTIVRARLLHASSMLSLFCIGMYAATFGPALPFVASDVGVSLDTAGLVLTALFAGSITASAMIALVLHSRDMRMLALAGLGCITAGLLLLGLASAWPTVLAAGVVLGAGDGLVIAALHVLVAAAAEDVPAAINELNLYFAFGAIVGPFWSGAILSTTGERSIAYTGIAAVAAVSALALFAGRATPSQNCAAPVEPIRVDRVATIPRPHDWMRASTAWAMGVVLFFYVGAEFGLGSWVSSFARETAGAGVFAAALLSCAYWAALALGRVLSGIYFARRGEASLLLLLSVGGAGIASLVLAIAAGNIAISAGAAFAAGLCLGPVWPTTVAITADAVGGGATPATVTLGNAGGLVIPWAQGRVLVGAGPQQGVLVTAVLCAIMFTAVSVFRIREIGVKSGSRDRG
jgi:fucose permease